MFQRFGQARDKKTKISSESSLKHGVLIEFTLTESYERLRISDVLVRRFQRNRSSGNFLHTENVPILEDWPLKLDFAEI